MIIAVGVGVLSLTLTVFMEVFMNNKKKGTKFEQKVCKMLADNGWWVHFLTPDNRGAQPFDIIAVKDGNAMAIDCKTCVDNVFRISRLEENQKYAFQKWQDCGNWFAGIYIEHNDRLYIISYDDLVSNGGKYDLELNKNHSYDINRILT